MSNISIGKPARAADAVFVRFVSDYALCNFKCPYCIVSKFQAKYKEDREWHEENYKVIVDHLSLLPFPINVRFVVRGEFFLQKTLVGGARFLSQADNCAGVNLISNLSFRSNQYDQVLDGFDLDKVAMVASFHPTEIKDVPAWVETARYLNSRIDFSVVLVAYPPLITQLSESVTMLRDAGLQVAVQAFVGTLEGRRYPQSYSDEEKEIIRHVMYSRHDYEHWINLKMPGLCDSGHKSFYVNVRDGIALSCGMGGGRVLGNLLESPNIDLDAGPAMCPNRTCLCDTENMNTVQFKQHYVRLGVNQHKYRYRDAERALIDPMLDEWKIDY